MVPDVSSKGESLFAGGPDAVAGGPPRGGPRDGGRGVKGLGRRRFLVRLVSIAGLVGLAYVLGAAAMFFDLPSSDVLHKAFVGARAWNERRRLAARAAAPAAAFTVTADKPGKTCDGFTLYTCAGAGGSNTRAVLVDMRGEVVHEWNAPASKVWPRLPYLAQGGAGDALVAFFGCHLYPNGDLLVVYHGLDPGVSGYGLARLDKDSNVRWKYDGKVHHDIDVGADGTIYAITHDVIAVPSPTRRAPAAPRLVDYLVLLSPEGEEVRKPIPLYDAFARSPYAALLASSGGPGNTGDAAGAPGAPATDSQRVDLMHTNHVHVLTPALAKKFPQFRAGQVLLSVRNLDAVAVLDLEKRAVVWAACGPWRAQHDAQFLDTGRLLLFDNLGSPDGSRVLEYDPQTQALPWSYAGEGSTVFVTNERGMAQRLPNGNTLVVDSEGGEIREVTRGKEVVWSASAPGFVTTARRYGRDQVQFLEGRRYARP